MGKIIWLVCLVLVLTGAGVLVYTKCTDLHCWKPEFTVQEEVLHHRTRRLLYGNQCSSKDITISQGRDGTSSAGIPQYVVQVVNTCLSDCTPRNIHLHCGWFASASLVNPNLFKRVAQDDCVVANGRALKHGEIIRFQYSNSFMYALAFKSAQFC